MNQNAVLKKSTATQVHIPTTLKMGHLTCVDPEGGSGSPHPENHKAIWSLSNAGQDCPENYNIRLGLPGKLQYTATI